MMHDVTTDVLVMRVLTVELAPGFLRSERQRQGLSQWELGRLVDARPDTVSRWETGVSPIPLAAALGLADALGLRPELSTADHVPA